MSPTYTAAIATAPDCVIGAFTDVAVLENEIRSYTEGPDGEEIPVYTTSGTVAMGPVETDVRTDDDDALEKAPVAAEEILAAHGWRVTGPWESSDNALYAPVERA